MMRKEGDNHSQEQKIGGYDLRNKLSSLVPYLEPRPGGRRMKSVQHLFDTIAPLMHKGWTLELSESEEEETHGSFGEEIVYRGRFRVYLRFSSPDLTIDRRVTIAEYKSTNTVLQRELDDPFSYIVDQQELLREAKNIVSQLRYEMAGGNGENKYRIIEAEKLRDHYPEFFYARKVLIDGWAKTMDAVLQSGETQEGLTVEQAQRAKSVCQLIVSEILEYKSSKVGGKRPLIVAAGNSAGIQKQILAPLEEQGIESLMSLPLAKNPEKYVVDSNSLILIAQPPSDSESKWGDELVGEYGIASRKFNVETVFLIGGGEKTTAQLQIYLDNALTAIRQGKRYRIVVVGGVGGFSEKETFEKALVPFQRDPQYKSLFNNSEAWLEYVESENSSALIQSIGQNMMGSGV